jgi:hypothetical protein
VVTPDARQRLLAEHRTEAEAFLEGLQDVEGRLADVIDEAALESRRYLDPWAHRRPDLDVILRGDAAEHGGITIDLAAEFLAPFNDEIVAAAGKTHPHTEFRLVGLSRGSTVLHLEPVTEDVAARDQVLPTAVTPAADAVAKVMDLHDRFETEQPADLISERTVVGLLKPARDLFAKLDEHDLEMELRWRAPQGPIRRSRLTGIGRAYAVQLFRTEDRSQTVELEGYVHGVNLSSGLTITDKPMGGKKTSIGISRDRLSAYRFGLGEHIKIVAEKTFKADSIGNESGATHQFTRLVERT